MRGHPCNTRKVAFQGRWLLIGGSFVYKMLLCGIVKRPPIGGWLLIIVAAHSRFYCIVSSVSLYKVTDTIYYTLGCSRMFLPRSFVMI